jgi:hypothetical protein
VSSFADDFKSDARRVWGRPAQRRVGGWSFVLSYGAVDAKEAANAAERAGIRTVYKDRDVTGEVLERLRAAKPTDEDELDGEWMLSAKLFPIGRSSTVEDWRFLGSMVASLGAPANSATKPIDSVDPNTTLYWVWRDG